MSIVQIKFLFRPVEISAITAAFTSSPKTEKLMWEIIKIISFQAEKTSKDTLILLIS